MNEICFVYCLVCRCCRAPAWYSLVVSALRRCPWILLGARVCSFVSLLQFRNLSLSPLVWSKMMCCQYFLLLAQIIWIISLTSIVLKTIRTNKPLKLWKKEHKLKWVDEVLFRELLSVWMQIENWSPHHSSIVSLWAWFLKYP